MDATTYKHIEFEMRKGEVERNETMRRLEERILKHEEPTMRVDVFEAINWIHFIDESVMSVVRFHRGPSSSPSGCLT